MIPVKSIYERDIDLLLLEEFSVNDRFRKWFLDQNGLPVETEFLNAWRSISDFNLGETDILISYRSLSGTVYLLLENKLDADFQEDQFSRYSKRASKYVTRGDCQEFFIILVAPQKYLDNQNEFEFTHSYEEIKVWFNRQHDPRSDFKARILNIAIEKLRRGYQVINDPSTFDFWLNYWQTLRATTSSLRMKKPKAVPRNSDWPVLENPEIKAFGFQILHKLSRGYIDAQNRSEFVKSRLNQMDLPENLSLHQTGKSLSIRIYTHILDKHKPFSEQKQQVDESIQKAIELLEWIKEHKDDFSTTPPLS